MPGQMRVEKLIKLLEEHKGKQVIIVACENDFTVEGALRNRG